MFLGDKASYLVQVIFGHDVDEQRDQGSQVGYAPVPMRTMHAGGSSFTVSLPGADSVGASKLTAQLIKLEDAGELINSDPRVSAGQALSRLLNLTDGMLGQGASVSVLVTTNEPIDRLHPAIARPGRSWADVEFHELAPDEANIWLKRAGSSECVTTATRLAELYGLVRGDQVVTFETLDT